MRRLPLGVAISVAVHATVVAAVVSRDEDPPPPPAPVVELVPPAPAAELVPDPGPIEVTFLPDDATAPAPRAPTARDAAELAMTEPRRASSASPGARGIDRPTAPGTGTPAAPAADTTTTTTTTPGHAPVFDMRRGTLSLRDLGVGRATDYGDALDHVAPPGTGAKPEVAETGKLQPDGGGTYRRDEGVFSAKIAADGSVKLHDGRNLNVHVPLAHPRALVRGVGRAIADWARDDNKGRPRPGPPETRISLKEAVPGQLDSKEAYGDGRVIDPGQAPVPIMGGSFDLTDSLMRRHKIDPYAARKIAFLDSTRDERVAIGQRHRAEQRGQATRIMKGNLDRLAASVPDPVARKQALFELWDECIETGSDADVAAGVASRSLVIGFIRAHLPADSTAAYTRAELAALNAHKQSRAVFAPYD